MHARCRITLVQVKGHTSHEKSTRRKGQHAVKVKRRPRFFTTYCETDGTPYARSLHCKDTTSFWKGVKSMRDSDVLLATNVGDAVGDANISKLWQDHFSTLLNSVQNNKSKTYVSESIKHGLAHADTVVITAPIVRECLKSIKLGKAAGLDGLAAEHFVYSHNIISVHLSLLFTGLLSHGYLPPALMKSAIVPILKNRQK